MWLYDWRMAVNTGDSTWLGQTIAGILTLQQGNWFCKRDSWAETCLLIRIPALISTSNASRWNNAGLPKLWALHVQNVFCDRSSCPKNDRLVIARTFCERSLVYPTVSFLVPSCVFYLSFWFLFCVLSFCVRSSSYHQNFLWDSLDDPQSFCCEIDNQNDREWSEILAHIVAVRTNKWIAKNCR
jgi:hypothetical protein